MAVQPKNMGQIPGGVFLMGSDNHYAEEAPVHRVAVDDFWMDKHAVTNAEFRRFVEATGYVTVAERPLDPTCYPNVRPELLVPGSVVFRKPHANVALGDYRNWWTYVPGANWHHPSGSGITLTDLDQHPVVHVAHEDAAAYAAWVGKNLPTEAEWEYAARGGLHGKTYAWGDEFTPKGCLMANTWQGEFPWENLRRDGYEGTAPVGSFPSNGYGLYDMTGNVWEWTADEWAWHHRVNGRHCCDPVHTRGNDEMGEDLGAARAHIPRKVIKGGSYLCAPNYCQRYRPSARSPQSIDTGACHVGFRCIMRL